MYSQKFLQFNSLISPGTKALCLLVVVLYLLGKIPLVEENVLVLPGYIIPARMKVWTIITAPFYESNILLVPVSIVIISGSAVVMEPLWGSKEFLIFQAIAGVSGTATVTLLHLLLYMISSSEELLFSPLHGFWPLLGGNLVALKQVKPDFSPVNVAQLRFKFWPMFVVPMILLICAIGVTSWSTLTLVLAGGLAGWVYLRFYQRLREGSKGDLSDSFSLATFFPQVMQPIVLRLSELTYGILVRFHICPKWIRSYDVSSSASTMMVHLPTSSETAESQRRKQKALKELNERLNKIEETTSWPSLEDTPSDVAAVSNTSNTQASERPPQKEDFVSITVNETSNNNEEQTV